MFKTFLFLLAFLSSCSTPDDLGPDAGEEALDYQEAVSGPREAVPVPPALTLATPEQSTNGDPCPNARCCHDDGSCHCCCVFTGRGSCSCSCP